MSELDHAGATNEQLRAAALELSEKRAQTYLTEPRRAQVGQELGHILFELRYRNGEFDRPQPTAEQLREFEEATGYGSFTD